MSSTPDEIRKTMTDALIEAGGVVQIKDIVDAIYDALKANDMLDVEEPEPVDNRSDLYIEEAISKLPADQQTGIREEISRIGTRAFVENMFRTIGTKGS